MAQMTAPESIVRAIRAARPGVERTRVLTALGLAEDGSPCSEEERASALAELVTLALGPELPAPAPAPTAVDDEEIPF
jgi:hypothetical protein